MASARGTDTNLRRAFVHGRLIVPNVIRIDSVSGQLVWCPRSGARAKVVAPSILDEFLALTEARPEAILRFAHAWGVLGICEHGLPATHNPSEQWHEEEPIRDWPFPQAPVHACGATPVGNCFAEPIEPWIRFARQADAILRVHEGPPHPRDQDQLWDTAFQFSTPNWREGEPKSGARGIESAAHNVRSAVNTWLRLGDVRPKFVWDSEAQDFIIGMGWSLREIGGPFDRTGLFGCLAGFLALRVADTDDFAVCYHCGDSYRPSRKPAAGRRNFCPDCGRAGVPQRYAQRAYAKKRRAQRS